jgi:alpha-galactosidase
MPLKIAFIGAGSLGFTRKLVRDCLTVPELAETHFALHDIDDRNLGMVERILRKDLDANPQLDASLSATLDRREALADADFVVNTSRIGGLDAFTLDIDIPLRYGVDQCVGDTLCVGGLMYGQRNVPEVLAFCRDMADVSKPGVRFLNYANPMAINTWAALDETPIETIGLCHGVEGGWFQIDSVLARLHGDPAIDYNDLADRRQRTQVICAGINHQTWYVDVRYQGRRVEGDELLKAFEQYPRLSTQEKVRIDVLRRFGAYSTESNGHLSEYLPWYRKRPEEIADWVDLSGWIHGETGGYLRVCTEGRNWFETDYPRWLEEAGRPIGEHRRSSEHGSYIVEAIATGRPYRGHFNVRNHGILPSLPADCVVEAPGYVDRFGLNMVEGIELPMACAATCRASIDVQRMAVRAAVTGDAVLLKQAVLHDPLTAAVCNPEEVWQMVDELLVAQAAWLPQYEASGAVEAARRALARHEAAGTRVRRRMQWRGSTRRPVRSVEALRAAKASDVMDADKAAAQRARDEKATPAATA